MVEQLDVAAIMAASEEPALMSKTLPKSKKKQEMLWQAAEKSGEKLSESERNQLYLLLAA